MRRTLTAATRSTSDANSSVNPGSPPLEAIELGHSAAVVAAAQSFAAASPDERFISLTCTCNLASVRRLTQDNPERTAKVREIAQIFLNKLRKDQAVKEAL
jgi:hypothetical protein